MKGVKKNFQQRSEVQKILFVLSSTHLYVKQNTQQQQTSYA